MNVIYEPKGKAQEYSPLACNLYRGCSHGCTYCYAPSVLRMTKTQFADGKPRNAIISALEKDAAEMDPKDTRRILLSFTSDCYQPLEADAKLTRQAIQILGNAGARLNILTKNPTLALRDLDLFQEYNVQVGSTIIFNDDSFRAQYEPHASPIAERYEAMEKLHNAGIYTWVSIEPVIVPEEALAVIRRMNQHIDLWKIGKWNYDAAANKIDWPEFLHRALDLLADLGASYYIKNDLWKLADSATRLEYSQSNAAAEFQNA